MALLGWLLAYWGWWIVLGSIVLIVRFPHYGEELADYVNDPLDEKLAMVVSYIQYLTLWPRKYWLLLRSEESDDENYDDHEEGTPGE